MVSSSPFCSLTRVSKFLMIFPTGFFSFLSTKVFESGYNRDIWMVSSSGPLKNEEKKANVRHGCCKKGHKNWSHSCQTVLKDTFRFCALSAERFNISALFSKKNNGEKIGDAHDISVPIFYLQCWLLQLFMS